MNRPCTCGNCNPIVQLCPDCYGRDCDGECTNNNNDD